MTKPLRLEDDAIAECVAICNALIADLNDAIYKASEIGWLTGFGGFVSAQQLQAGFQNKIQGTPESMVERLTQFRDVIEVMKDTFAAGGEAFADADGAFQQAMLAIQADIDA